MTRDEVYRMRHPADGKPPYKWREIANLMHVHWLVLWALLISPRPWS